MDVRVGLKKSWAPNNWCFWTVVLEKTLESPWTVKRSNQSILKEVSPEYSLEGLMLKLKLQYFGHLMWRNDSFEKTLMLGKIEGGRRRGQQRMRRLDGITDSMNMSFVNSRSWLWTGRPGVLQSMGSQKVGHESDWTELNWVNTWMNKLKLCYAPGSCLLYRWVFKLEKNLRSKHWFYYTVIKMVI